MEVIARSATNLQVEITVGRHQFLSDEPPDLGDDAGTDPYDLLLAALGACTVMTLRLYARRKQWPLAGVEVRLNTFESHERDVERSESDPHARVDVIERRLSLRGDLSAAQLARLTE